MISKLFVPILLFLLQISKCDKLYTNIDAVEILNTQNFESSVILKPYAIVVEFYNSWCGHCIRFAPKWKKFAKSIGGKVTISYFLLTAFDVLEGASVLVA